MLSCVVDAATTGARTAPMNTIFSAGTGLKCAPLMVTTVPMGPDLGVKPVIEGGWAKALTADANRRKTRLSLLRCSEIEMDPQTLCALPVCMTIPAFILFTNVAQ
jgi:hypothetical protein